MDSKNFAARIAKKWKSGWQDSCCPERQKSEGLKMLVKYIIKVFLYLILAVMTLIRWL